MIGKTISVVGAIHELPLRRGLTRLESPAYTLANAIDVLAVINTQAKGILSI